MFVTITLFYVSDSTDITFELHVKQAGVNWIGFGLSKNGGMHNSVRYFKRVKDKYLSKSLRVELQLKNSIIIFSRQR